MQNSKCKIFVSILFLFSVFHFPLSVDAQVRPIYDQGAVGLGQLLKRLNNTKSVMMIGAHPDDEDSALLAYLARGENARTAYLSLTRGDGGQNVIGPELFESLGVIRTEELLQARRLDGAEQYFTRAFDYGFSKTLAEAKEKWGEKEILCDTVQAIRTFRPLIVISRFSGTPNDGHGQHQYAGYITPLAVKAAADPMQCQNSGAPWQVLKFYVGQSFRSTEEPTLKINTGKYDFLLGRSYAEIAAEGRSQHKTQEQGGLELKGDRFSGLNLVESNVPKIQDEKSIFDGIDVSLTGAAKTFVEDETAVNDFTKQKLAAIQNSVERANNEFNPNDPRRILPILAAGKNALIAYRDDFNLFSGTEEERKKNMPRQINESKLSDILSIKWREFDEAIRLAAGIRIEALTEQETAVPGEEFAAVVKLFFPADLSIKVKELDVRKFCHNVDSGGCDQVHIKKANAPTENVQNPYRREIANESAYFKIKLTDTKMLDHAKLTQPYWLTEKIKDNLFTWTTNVFNLNLPFDVPLLSAAAEIEIAETKINILQSFQYRYADDVRGEIRREFNVVPKVSLSFNQDLLIVPNSDKPQTRQIVLNVKNNSSTAFSGSANLYLPGNWKVKQNFGIVQLNKKDESKSFAFDVIIPANAENGSYKIGANIKSGEEFFRQTMHTIAYPHIQTHRFYTDAVAKIEVLDLKVAPVKVGYIMGSGDAVPDAIRQMGLNVEMLGEKDLANGDLSGFDVIVVGIRASEVRADFVANNGRILDYVKNGGTLVVQYQKNAYLSQNLAPFPAKMAARVAEEDARVTIIEPNSPVFNFPNKITQKDFENWVQERNLYAFTTFDERYTPLLEAHDTGEPENKGGMVYAEIGKGKFVYTSYAFFRQLPAGVPGAYRLFANLLSLPKAK